MSDRTQSLEELAEEIRDHHAALEEMMGGRREAEEFVAMMALGLHIAAAIRKCTDTSTRVAIGVELVRNEREVNREIGTRADDDVPRREAFNGFLAFLVGEDVADEILKADPYL